MSETAKDYREPAEVVPGLERDDAEAAELEAETRTARVTEAQHRVRLDHVLVSMAGEFSRAHLQGLVERGLVTINGAVPRNCSRKVLAGDVVELQLVDTAESQAFRPEPMDLRVIYEDAHVMVVDKPAGLVVHPAPGNWSGTLMNGLLAYHAGAAALPRGGIVHRLDKDTTGLMAVGKSIEAVTGLVRAIAAREVSREYLALTHGEPVQEAFLVDAPIGRDPISRVRMAVVSTGKPAQTDVIRLAVRDRVAAFRCILHTGRTHQIRVHLASRGFPLVADTVYGGKPALGMSRQALHATRLAFAHPVTGSPLAFEAPLHADMASAWEWVVS